MLTFLALSSAIYITLYAIFQPRLAAKVKKFNPARGTRKGNKVIYPPNSPEGRILQTLIYGTFLWMGAIVTLVFTLFIGIVWGF